MNKHPDKLSVRLFAVYGQTANWHQTYISPKIRQFPKLEHKKGELRVNSPKFPITAQLQTLSDRLTEAHQQIQQAFAEINPVIGISQQMRSAGIAADTITIDCLSTNRRIVILLLDQAPDMARYQFGLRDQDPSCEFEQIALAELNTEKLRDWMADYFSANTH